MNTAENMTATLKVKDGDTFKIAGIEFIKFPDKDGITPVVAKDILFRSEFGDNNDLRASKVMKRLKEVDEVAYVRFASVYRSFKDINTFMDELSTLLTEQK